MSVGRPTSWVYGLRSHGKKGFTLNVPKVVGEQIPQGTLFKLEVTGEGLLYVPLSDNTAPPESIDLPWLGFINSREAQ